MALIVATYPQPRSWMLETDKGVVQTVLSLLKPEGLIFQAVVKFMSYSQLTLRFPLAMLPVQKLRLTRLHCIGCNPGCHQ